MLSNDQSRVKGEIPRSPLIQEATRSWQIWLVSLWLSLLKKSKGMIYKLSRKDIRMLIAEPGFTANLAMKQSEMRIRSRNVNARIVSVSIKF